MIGFVTLCEGKGYAEKTERLAESIKENSDYPLHVYTCSSTVFNAHEVINIRDFSEAPTRIHASFNYNLKGIILNNFLNTTNYHKIIYLDCDVIMKKPTTAFEREMNNHDLWANVSRFSKEHVNLQSGQKFRNVEQQLNLDETDILKAKYVNECIMIFNRSHATHEMFKTWANICERVSRTKITPAYECVELAIAIQQTEGFTYDLVGKTSLADHVFESEHRGKFIPIVKKV